MHTLTALFTKKQKRNTRCFYCMNSTPKVPGPKEPFFGEHTMVSVQPCCKKKGNKIKAMKGKLEDGGLSLFNNIYSLFLPSSPQPAKATGRCSITLQMDQEWHTYSYICLAHSYFLLYITCQLTRQ